MYTQRSADSNRLWRVHSALLRFWPRKKEREKKGKNFFLITIQCSRGEHWKYIPHTSCVSAVSSCNRSYPIERYKSRARVDESCGSRRYARDHTRVDDSCFLLSRLLSLPLLGQTTAARIREYLITRVVSIQFLCTSDHHRSLPLVRRFRESDALFTHNSSTCIYRRVDRMKGKERLIFA